MLVCSEERKLVAPLEPRVKKNKRVKSTWSMRMLAIMRLRHFQSVCFSPHLIAPRAYHSPLLFTPQVFVTPLQRHDLIQIQSDEPKQNAMFSEKRIPTLIIWNHDGKQVAIEGSWDNWKTREFLQRSGRDLAVMKVLPSGVYHYRFIVDGQRRFAPDLPQKRDDMRNIFKILDLQERRLRAQTVGETISSRSIEHNV